MKRSALVFSLISALALVVGNASATDMTTGRVMEVTVKSQAHTTSQNLVVKLYSAPGQTALPLCFASSGASTGPKQAKISSDDATFSEMVRVVSAARLSGRKLTIGADYVNSTWCDIKWVRLED